MNKKFVFLRIHVQKSYLLKIEILLYKQIRKFFQKRNKIQKFQILTIKEKSLIKNLFFLRIHVQKSYLLKIDIPLYEQIRKFLQKRNKIQKFQILTIRKTILSRN